MKDSQLKDIVRIAIGFSTKKERSRWRKKPDSYARNGAFKKEPHQVSTPFQLVLTYTRKAIANEDGFGRFSDSHNAMEELLELEASRQEKEIVTDGIKPWIDWYHNRALWSDTRYVLDIARYTDDKKQADEWLGKPAKDGWNKNDKQIVILNGREPVGWFTNGFSERRLQWSFGPIGTAWLAAMAPRMNYRYLVMHEAVKQLMQFYNEDVIDLPVFTGSIKRQERLRQWYAFHTLRRMFRMRFGCSLTNTPEIQGPLNAITPSNDPGYRQYKKGLSETLLDLGIKASG